MHYKSGLASVWAVLITMVIMLGLAGGGYYYLNKQNESKKTDLQNQITELEKQIALLKKPAATASTSASTTPATGLVYENKTYNFSLTFDTKWSSWKIKYAKIDGSTATYYVEVPTADANYAKEELTHDAGYASMFALSVYTPAEWTAVQSGELNTDTKLKENANYVFAWSHAQASPDDVMAKGIWDDIDNIIKTFKLN